MGKVRTFKLLKWYLVENREIWERKCVEASAGKLSNFTRRKENESNYEYHDKQLLRRNTLLIKGCGMGPWFVLVPPCFRENVVATCKFGSFLYSLDNLLQKNVIVLFFGNQISKMALI